MFWLIWQALFLSEEILEEILTDLLLDKLANLLSRGLQRLPGDGKLKATLTTVQLLVTNIDIMKILITGNSLLDARLACMDGILSETLVPVA